MNKNFTEPIWIKRYLMKEEDWQFHEIRHFKSVGLINRKNNNIGGYHFSLGKFDACSELKAIYEYIERYTCSETIFDDIKVYETDKISYLNLNDLGFDWTKKEFLYPKEAEFIEAKSLKTDSSYLVPSVFAYYLKNDFKTWGDFYGNSNGNALGSSLNDAIERGILEFIERDKFIRYWYLSDGNILKIDNLDELMGNKLKYFDENNYQVDCYLIDNKPNDIFSVWCLIRSKRNDEKFFSVTGLGSGMTLEQAINSAFIEAEGIYFSQRYIRRNHQGYKEIVTKDNLDTNLGIYLSYDIMDALNSLVDNANSIKPVWTAIKRRASIKTKALEYYKDIIYVPINHKILDDLGLYAVKVSCLGGKNMYFDCGDDVVKKAKLGKVSPLA